MYGLSKRAGVDPDASPVPHQGLPALELLEGHVHAGVAEGQKGGLEAAGSHHAPKIAELAARQLQQGKVRTARVAKHAALGHPQEVRLALGQTPADEGPGLREGEGLAEEPAKPPRRIARTSSGRPTPHGSLARRLRSNTYHGAASCRHRSCTGPATTARTSAEGYLSQTPPEVSVRPPGS